LGHYNEGVRFYDNDKQRSPISDVVSLNSETTIFGSLRTGTFSSRGYNEEEITYSFFGNSNPVDQIGFEICEAKSSEFCRLIGWPGASAGGGFTIVIGVTPEKLDHLASRVRDGDIDWINIMLGKIDGFYSEWAPGGDINKIKLMPFKCGDVEIQGIDKEKLETLPTLRGVGEVEISFGSRSELFMASSEFAVSNVGGEHKTKLYNEFNATLLKEVSGLRKASILSSSLLLAACIYAATIAWIA
jgi:hypothetical protein